MRLAESKLTKEPDVVRGFIAGWSPGHAGMELQPQPASVAFGVFAGQA
jgi:hypothetical protein